MRGKGQLPHGARAFLGIESCRARLVVRVDPAEPGRVVLELPVQAVRALRGRHAGLAARYFGGAVPHVPAEVVLPAEFDERPVLDAGVLAVLLDGEVTSDRVAEQITDLIVGDGARIAEWSLQELRAALVELHRGDRDALEAMDDPKIAAVVEQVIAELEAIGIERVLPDQRQAVMQQKIALSSAARLRAGEVHTLALAAATGQPAVVPVPVEQQLLARLDVTLVSLGVAMSERADEIGEPADALPESEPVEGRVGDSPVAALDASGSDGLAPLMRGLFTAMNAYWHTDFVPWTSIQHAAAQHEARYTTRKAVDRGLAEALGEHMPEQRKHRSGSWGYGALELWAAVNTASVKAGRAPVFNANSAHFGQFLDLLAAALATLDRLGEPVENYTQREFVATLREDGVSAPGKLVPRLWWVLRHRADEAREWVAALEAHEAASRTR
ncbi:hypothetical protein GCM10023192_88840 [Amycolatopsis samaneae]